MLAWPMYKILGEPTGILSLSCRNFGRPCEEHRELPSPHPQFSPYFRGLRRNVFRSSSFAWILLICNTTVMI